MRKIKTIFTFLLATLLLLSLAGCGSDGSTRTKDEKVVIKFSHVVAETTPKGQAALKFKELVEQKSGGKMEVQVFPSSQLFGDKEELEALQANNVQLIAPSVTKLVGFVPAFQLVDMPFLFSSDQAAYNFYDGPAGQKLMKSLEPKGMLGMAWWPNGAKHFTNSKRPLKTPADFKGLKFRTQSGGLLDAQFKALGAGSQTLAFAEVYQALQNGTVDGQENTFNNIDTQKYVEVQKYLTVSGHGRLDYVVLTNTKFWQSLTPEQQQIINEAMQEATAFERKLAEELNAKSFAKIKESGKVEVYELTETDRAAFIKALEPVYAEYTDKIGREYIEAARASQ
ncbi:TRAP transporter substrate-binding protein [Desulforamulus hydrothermalis]|uniref:Transporter n=1 Tax=Desulforamulus hydrothermalis Lam5 = DSM 18033 TaxID=1121428 RepID=K8E132_9FIRM|nr:TRAP transporter substrate-binding protein [Desulforamulus hydrothermalis]CCO09340.1 transporter [Desulforamulus hydrothermalis Lam5 = DSM 18033]SHH32696.1 C4-dicarboxylate-binding protein DctP [Desulforamulus hydrothermalis Lam5 = DSM 18033]